MLKLVAFSLLALAVLAVIAWWRRVQLSQQARTRLNELPPVVEPPDLELDSDSSIFRRHRAWPVATGVVTGLLIYFAINLGFTFAVAFSVIVILLGLQFESWLHERKQVLAERQLSDAVDIMIGGLQAGGGVLSALESAIRESRQPLRPELEEVLGRIRLGDEPQGVLNRLAERIPLETFRLFSTTLAVHWEVGGSLAPTLATVGKTIRDRIEIARRIRSMTAQGRISIIAILGTTFFIGLVIWSNDPGRMERFLRTLLGQNLVAGAMILEAVGVVWANRLMKMKF